MRDETNLKGIGSIRATSELITFSAMPVHTRRPWSRGSGGKARRSL